MKKDPNVRESDLPIKVPNFLVRVLWLWDSVDTVKNLPPRPDSFDDVAHALLDRTLWSVAIDKALLGRPSLLCELLETADPPTPGLRKKLVSLIEELARPSGGPTRKPSLSVRKVHQIDALFVALGTKDPDDPPSWKPLAPGVIFDRMAHDLGISRGTLENVIYRTKGKPYEHFPRSLAAKRAIAEVTRKPRRSRKVTPTED